VVFHHYTRAETEYQQQNKKSENFIKKSLLFTKKSGIISKRLRGRM
jgi:hypothetical protein